MIPRFSDKVASDPTLSPTPISPYNVPYDRRASSPNILSLPPSNATSTTLSSGDIRSKYSLLHTAHRDLQKKYDKLKSENALLSQKLKVTMVAPIKPTNSEDDERSFIAHNILNDVVLCTRKMYEERIWEDVEIIRGLPDYVGDYFCFYVQFDTGSSKPGSFVICSDYVCFVYNDKKTENLVFPLKMIARVSVSILPLGEERNASTYQWDSTLCMDIQMKDKHFRFFGFQDIEAVILSLQGPDGKKLSTTVTRQWEADDDDDTPLNSPSSSVSRKTHRHMYRSEILEVEKELWSRINQSAAWPLLYDRDDIQISSFTPRDEPVIFRTTCIIDALPREVWSAYYDIDQRLQWDKLLKPSTRVIDKIDPRTDVLYSCVGSTIRGFVSARDYIDIRRWIPQPDGQSILIVYRGVAWYPTLPPDIGQNSVRGQNHTCGFLFEPLIRDGRATPSCKVTIIIQTQANGWVPQSFVDRATLKYIEELPLQLRSYFAATATN